MKPLDWVMKMICPECEEAMRIRWIDKDTGSTIFECWNCENKETVSTAPNQGRSDNAEIITQSGPLEDKLSPSRADNHIYDGEGIR